MYMVAVVAASDVQVLWSLYVVAMATASDVQVLWYMW